MSLLLFTFFTDDGDNCLIARLRSAFVLMRGVHDPVQRIAKDKFFKNVLRRTYAGMVDTLDEAVGDITEAFRTAGFTLRRWLSGSTHYTDYIIKRFFELW